MVWTCHTCRWTWVMAQYVIWMANHDSRKFSMYATATVNMIYSHSKKLLSASMKSLYCRHCCASIRNTSNSILFTLLLDEHAYGWGIYCTWGKWVVWAKFSLEAWIKRLLRKRRHRWILSVVYVTIPLVMLVV